VRRRAAREPLQYLTGECEFLGLMLHVDRAVLVPRPETEELVESVLGWDLPVGATAFDLGTGSGCIAVALAVRRPDLEIVAIDRSAAALAVARANAARHAVASRIRFVHADFAQPLADWGGTGGLVVSNPPYVSEEEWRGLAPEVRDFEPREALVPGPTGHEAYAVVAKSARALLGPGGKLAVELGWKSLAEARAAFAAAGFERIEAFDDARGIARILRGVKGGA
jgi:release factor glutamine methyltransferase